MPAFPSPHMSAADQMYASGPLALFKRVTRPARAAFRAGVFFLKVFPMLPSRAINWVTPAPVVERVRYPTRAGQAEGDLYRPASRGPHAGIVVCLGVVPFEVNHPQVPILGSALARAGFAALLYWSPAMRDMRLEPGDVENISLAYDWLIHQPSVDPARSGILGTCVGGAFGLMAAASPLIQDHLAFVSAYAPFSSMWTFTRDIASASRTRTTLASGGPRDGSLTPAHQREPWAVDPLTRKVFVHSLTHFLQPAEGERLGSAFLQENGVIERASLSPAGQAVYDLLASPDASTAQALLHSLPPAVQEQLTAMSPTHYLTGIHAPIITLLHDRGDQVIPVGESRRLVQGLKGHRGLRYTEMLFQHLDPVKGKLPLLNLIHELAKFFRAVYPIFLQST